MEQRRLTSARSKAGQHKKDRMILALDPGIGKLLTVGIAVFNGSQSLPANLFPYVGTFQVPALSGCLRQLDNHLTNIETTHGPFAAVAWDSWGHRKDGSGKQLVIKDARKQEDLRNHLCKLALKRGWPVLAFPSGEAKRSYKDHLQWITVSPRSLHEKDAIFHALKADEIYRLSMAESDGERNG